MDGVSAGMCIDAKASVGTVGHGLSGKLVLKAELFNGKGLNDEVVLWGVTGLNEKGVDAELPNDKPVDDGDAKELPGLKVKSELTGWEFCGF